MSRNKPLAAGKARPVAPVPRFALRKEDAAESLGMSVDSFERHVQPFIKTVAVGSMVLVPPVELERWVRDNARYLAGEVA